MHDGAVARGARTATHTSEAKEDQRLKKTDLYKNEGLKISGQMKRQGTPGRFGSEAGAALERREQRKLDQSLGLVPFAVKLPADLAQAVRALAQSRNIGLNELVADVLRKGMAD